MKKKIFLTLLVVAMLACALAVTVSAAVVTDEIKYSYFPQDYTTETIEGIEPSDHIHADILAEYPEVVDARIKLSCSCEQGYHIYPAYYVSSNSYSDYFRFDYTEINQLKPCGKTYNKHSIIALEIPNGYTILDGNSQNNNSTYGVRGSTSLQYVDMSGCETLTTLETKNDHEPFVDCKALKYVKFSSTTENIPGWCFIRCSELLIVDIPGDSQIKKIGTQAFKNCSKLTALYLPDGVKSIGYLSDGVTTEQGSGNNDAGTEGSGRSTFAGCSKLFFVNNPEDTEKPEVYYMPESLERMTGEFLKEISSFNKVIVFGENFKCLNNGYAFANKNGGSVFTLIFEGDFTAEDATFLISCEYKSRNIYFTHPNVKDTSFITYASDWQGNTPTANIYLCAVEEAYTMSGTPSNDIKVKDPISATYTKLDSFSHVFEKTVTTAPTCTENSFVVEYCYCGYEISKTELENTALGHSYNSVVTEPDCLNGGYTTYTCPACGDTYVDNKVDALGHSMSGWTITTAPVYGKAGVQTNKCANCDYSETKEYNAAAVIGDVYYASFEEAYASVRANETIVLLAPITVVSDTTLNIDGITIESAGDVFVVTGGTLTIEGNGTVKAGTAGVGSWCAVWADGGNVVINGGTYYVGGDSETSDVNHQNDLVYTKHGGTVVINGGTFNAQEGIWALNENDKNRGTITVNGGTFIGFNPANNVAEGANTNFVADGYHASAADGVYTVVEHIFSVYGIVYENGFGSAGVKTYKCDGCDATKTEAAEALFTNNGYSVPEDGVAGITVGFSVNATAIKEYTELTGSELNYGVFAVLKDNIKNDVVIDESGKPALGVISKEITEYQLASFNLKIVGFETEEHKTAQLAMGAYVIETDGASTSVSYVQANAPVDGETFSYVAYCDYVPSGKEDN